MGTRSTSPEEKLYIYIYIKVDPTRKHNFLLKTNQQRTAPNNNSDDDDGDGDGDTHIHTYRERREEEEAEAPFMCAASATAASAHGYAQAHTRVHPSLPPPSPFSCMAREVKREGDGEACGRIVGVEEEASYTHAHTHLTNVLRGVPR